MDGRAEIGVAATVANSVFGAEFTGLALQVAPRFDVVLPSGLWMSLSEAARTKLAAFPVSISRIGFGQEGDEKWVGLDAAVDFGKGIGPAASVKGLRVFFDGPRGIHLTFDGIGLELVRPGFSFHGFVEMTTGADDQGIADPVRQDLPRRRAAVDRERRRRRARRVGAVRHQGWYADSATLPSTPRLAAASRSAPR